MDILIKSFNRPYYLDRCLFSIQKFGINFTGSIYVLDDGTPQKFLDKIVLKYPYIKIVKTEFYDKKSKLIQSNSIKEILEIPIKTWITCAGNTSEYFLLIEDDFWFIRYFNFGFFNGIVKDNDLAILKLIWLGNKKVISGITQREEKKYLIYKPNLDSFNPFYFKLFFCTNRFKIRKIFKQLNVFSDKKCLNYYSIYSVAGAVFNKEYFVNLWKNNNGKVDEKLQIYNALKFLGKKNHFKFARTNVEYFKTGFISSATNKKDNNIQIDMFQFNNVLNESWLKGEFLTTQDLKNDICEEKIMRVLENHKEENHIKGELWKSWVLSFKNQFRAIGCKID
ncbi:MULTISPECIES: hypothetical protein [Flavobacterium]|uniref:Glycosyl transferase family 2 n=1 Tax=Flavobacterium jumunjinense TaxID=998845 RepID=A0ABV5GIA2_9FLAO|nr:MULTISPECIES: hypothetical protein [Flavobacterium]